MQLGLESLDQFLFADSNIVKFDIKPKIQINTTSVITTSSSPKYVTTIKKIENFFYSVLHSNTKIMFTKSFSHWICSILPNVTNLFTFSKLNKSLKYHKTMIHLNVITIIMLNVSMTHVMYMYALKTIVY